VDRLVAADRVLTEATGDLARMQTEVPRLALTKQEAAEALGVSVDFFDEHIAHELRMVRRGRRRLVPVRELERWVEEHADLAGA
jgi:excisionase family DNA binding protein